MLVRGCVTGDYNLWLQGFKLVEGIEPCLPKFRRFAGGQPGVRMVINKVGCNERLDRRHPNDAGIRPITLKRSEDFEPSVLPT